MFRKIQEKKTRTIQLLNDKGEVVREFDKYAIVYHCETYVVHFHGSMEEAEEAQNAMHKKGFFKYDLIYSDDWKCDELEAFISEPGYIENFDYEPESDFVDEGYIGQKYSCRRFEDEPTEAMEEKPKEDTTRFSIETSGIDMDLIPDDLKEKLGL